MGSSWSHCCRTNVIFEGKLDRFDKKKSKFSRKRKDRFVPCYQSTDCRHYKSRNVTTESGGFWKEKKDLLRCSMQALGLTPMKPTEKSHPQVEVKEDTASWETLKRSLNTSKKENEDTAQ